MQAYFSSGAYVTYFFIVALASLLGGSWFLRVCLCLFVRFNTFNFRFLSFHRSDFSISELFFLRYVGVAESVRIVIILLGFDGHYTITMLFGFYAIAVNVSGLLGVFQARLILYLCFLGLLTNICGRSIVIFLTTFLRGRGADEGAYSVRGVYEGTCGYICMVLLLGRRLASLTFHETARGCSIEDRANRYATVVRIMCRVRSGDVVDL